jgi:hypothetical protein
MKPIAVQRVLRDVRKACKAAGIVVNIESAKGDHIALIFSSGAKMGARCVSFGTVHAI